MASLSVYTASSNGVMLLTFPSAVNGVIQSDLNYSVVLECLASYITPKPVLHWTLQGKPYDTGSMLIIRRVSLEHLGTYMCIAKNSQGQYTSTPVTLFLPLPRESPSPTPDFCVLAGLWSALRATYRAVHSETHLGSQDVILSFLLPSRLGILSPFYRRKR